MKLRLHKDSIRFRFTRGEVDVLFAGGTLEESVALGPADSHRLTYRVVPEVEPGTGAIRADLDGNVLTVSISHAAVSEWRNGAQLGMEARQTWPGGQVRILLEKDLQRLNPKEGEELADVFPNPQFGKAHCDHP